MPTYWSPCKAGAKQVSCWRARDLSEWFFLPTTVVPPLSSHWSPPELLPFGSKLIELRSENYGWLEPIPKKTHGTQILLTGPTGAR